MSKLQALKERQLKVKAAHEENEQRIIELNEKQYELEVELESMTETLEIVNEQEDQFREAIEQLAVSAATDGATIADVKNAVEHIQLEFDFSKYEEGVEEETEEAQDVAA